MMILPGTPVLIHTDKRGLPVPYGPGPPFIPLKSAHALPQLTILSPQPPTMVYDRQPRSQQQWERPRQTDTVHPSSISNDVMIYETSVSSRSDS